DMLKNWGSMDDKMATALKVAGACRMNVVISGGTGSGKTTMLNALSKMIDPGERVLTIEDAAELRLQQPHWLPLETRPPNLEGQGAITIGDLVKNALRMRPDRIILGELRGKEAMTFLEAINTGHGGSMTTLHAETPQLAVQRLAIAALKTEIPMTYQDMIQYIESSIDVIIQAGREDGERGITEFYLPGTELQERHNA
ncbi:MAG: CpaF/VirB11 family protein, partial [Pseudomonadota bacterium]|nr:CpaF/VirB11 family protein [Pseudomonadota bacterium]